PGGHRRDAGGAGSLHPGRPRPRPPDPNQRGDAGVQLPPLADRLHRAGGYPDALARFWRTGSLSGGRRVSAPGPALRAGVMARAQEAPAPRSVDAAPPARGAALVKRVLRTVVVLPGFG